MSSVKRNILPQLGLLNKDNPAGGSNQNNLDMVASANMPPESHRFWGRQLTSWKHRSGESLGQFGEKCAKRLKRELQKFMKDGQPLTSRRTDSQERHFGAQTNYFRGGKIPTHHNRRQKKYPAAEAAQEEKKHCSQDANILIYGA